MVPMQARRKQKNNAKAKPKLIEPCTCTQIVIPTVFCLKGGAQPMARDSSPPEKLISLYTVIIFANNIDLCFDFTTIL